MRWNFSIILNLALAIICCIHITIILISYLYPETPNVKKYVKDLKDIEFPVIFKICFEKANEDEILQAFGYKHMFDFYRGNSMYKKNVYGWNGHTKNGTTLGSVEGSFETFNNQ